MVPGWGIRRHYDTFQVRHWLSEVDPCLGKLRRLAKFCFKMCRRFLSGGHFTVCYRFWEEGVIIRAGLWRSALGGWQGLCNVNIYSQFAQWTKVNQTAHSPWPRHEVITADLRFTAFDRGFWVRVSPVHLPFTSLVERTGISIIRRKPPAAPPQKQPEALFTWNWINALYLNPAKVPSRRNLHQIFAIK